MSGRFARRAGQGTGRSAGDARGAIAVLTAMLLPVLIGIAAWAIDASLLLYRQERLQLAADIGALGGGELLLSGGTEAQAIAFAQRLAAANVGGGSAATMTATFPEPDRLELNASQPVPRFFSQIFGAGDFTIRAATVAEIMHGTSNAPDACLYLDDDGTTNRALHLNRSSTVVLEGCAAVVASTHPARAVALERGARLQAGCLDVAGGISDPDQVRTTLCPAPRTGEDPIPLPPTFADIKPPRPGGREYDEEDEGCADEDEDGKSKGKGKHKDDEDEDRDEDEDSGPARLTPGAPFQDGMAQLRFPDGLKVCGEWVGGPGIYFFEKNLKIENGATLTLDPGAIIVLLEDAVIDMDDDATLEITAPEDGKWTGIAIIAGPDRDDPDDREHKLTGLKIDGALVLPGEEIEFEGTSSGAPCMPILAGTLELKDDARLEMSCSGDGDGTGGKVRLLPNP